MVPEDCDSTGVYRYVPNIADDVAGPGNTYLGSPAHEFYLGDQSVSMHQPGRPGPGSVARTTHLRTMSRLRPIRQLEIDMTSLSPIFLDATPEFDTGPIALYPVLGRPWLATFLDMVADANGTSRLVVIAAPEFSDEIQKIVSEHANGAGVRIVSQISEDRENLRASVACVYTRHLFIRSLKRGHREFGRAVLATINAPDDMTIASEMASREAPGHRTILVHRFYRPVARRIAEAIAPTGITPNAITLMSLMVIPVATAFIVYDSYILGVIAAGLLQSFFLLDVVDGMLARVMKIQSKFGYWFDTIVDTIHDSTMPLAFTAGVIVSTGNAWFAIPGGIWVVANSATWSNQLIEAASGQDSAADPAAYAVERPPARSRLGVSLILWVIKRARWAVAQPEIILSIFTIGLLANAEIVVLWFFAINHLASTVRMFQISYFRYRREEIDIQSDE